MTDDPIEPGSTLGILRKQLHITWSLARAVLTDLTDDECLRAPSAASYTVRRDGPGGTWVADWEEPEPWPAPPTSLAWLQWHAIWWWSMVIDHSFGGAALRREDVTWPGAGAATSRLEDLHDEWVVRLDDLDDDDLRSAERTRWPYTDGRPFGQVVGWVNVELTKNVAEMSVARRSTPYYADGRFAGGAIT
jgi:hypothetical protein